MGRLIDVDAFKKKVCTYQQTGCGDCKYSLCCPEDAPTVEAIPRKQIDEMIAEIRDYSNKHTTINVDTKKVVVEALLCIIHKYCDKEQTDD